ncbi:hypothetical protein B0H66DRAFT_354942 [Apodospora peruviana]|uniref:Uncharacterized protein n=1 Tax=Apodospora peruviana TaxID=516989 RepID=A0AAE0HVI7_9PEZI|nr:hypothetical protein B0H66DRAFT_354942 [Apodospora peruviana]
MSKDNLTPSYPFASLSLHKSDSIRFLQFPEEIYTEAQSVILKVWPPGIQTSGPYGESYQYKLKKRPFGSMGDQEAVGGARLVRNMITFLSSRSWDLVTPLLCSRHLGAKDTLIFRKRSPETPPPPPVEWLTVSMLRSDRLRIIYDASSEIDADHGHLGLLIASLKKMLEEMDYFQKGDWSFDSFEFKLKGLPWPAHGVNTVKTRMLMLRVLDVLDSFGWESRVNIGQRSGTDDYRMPDCWYFVRPRTGRRSGATTTATVANLLPSRSYSDEANKTLDLL